MNNVILLTACINTNNCAYLARADYKTREEDYYIALEKWLTNTNFEFVFVENSNSDLTKFHELSKLHGDRVEFLQFDGNNYNRGFGKGHGENIAIAYAVDHSEKLKNEDFIHKVSGRYYLTKAPVYITELNQHNAFDNIDIVGHYKEELFRQYHSVPTVYFSMRKSVYNERFRNFHVNDSNGVYLEHGMFKVVVSLPQERVLYVEEVGIEPTQVASTNNGIVHHLK